MVSGLPDWLRSVGWQGQFTDLYTFREYRVRIGEMKSFAVRVDLTAGTYAGGTFYTVPSGKVAYVTDVICSMDIKGYFVVAILNPSGVIVRIPALAWLQAYGHFAVSLATMHPAYADYEIRYTAYNYDTVDGIVRIVATLVEAPGSTPSVKSLDSAYDLYEQGLFNSLVYDVDPETNEGILILHVDALKRDFTVKGPKDMEQLKALLRGVKLNELEQARVKSYYKRRGYRIEVK